MSNIILSSSEVTMSSREIAVLTGKEVKNVHRDILKMVNELAGTDGSKLSHVEYQGLRVELDDRGYVSAAHLNRELTDCLLTGYSAKARMAVIKRWHELESKQKPAIPDFSDPAEAAEAWAAQYRLAQQAIATKAEIGSRREATAMNTASVQAKRANKLEIELDKSKQCSTIKRMEMLTGLKFDWRKLKAAEQDLGIERTDVFDANYGTVRSYHADAWMDAYALDINQESY